MKYKMTLGYYTQRVIEVEAENMDEARNKAHSQATDDLTYGQQTELIDNLNYDGIYDIEEVKQ